MIAVSSATDDMVLSTIQAISKEAKQLRQNMLKAKRNTKKATTEETDKLKSLLKQLNSFSADIKRIYLHLYSNPQTKLTDYSNNE